MNNEFFDCKLKSSEFDNDSIDASIQFKQRNIIIIRSDRESDKSIIENKIFFIHSHTYK